MFWLFWDVSTLTSCCNSPGINPTPRWDLTDDRLGFHPCYFLIIFCTYYVFKRCWVKVRSPHFEGIYPWMSQDQSRENDEYCKHFKGLHDYIVMCICCEIESCLWIYMSRFKTWLIILFWAVVLRSCIEYKDWTASFRIPTSQPVSNG